MDREIAIKIEGLKKMYKLGQIGGGTLYGDLQSWWARVRGKEDPNSKIGTDMRSYGKTFMALNGIDMTIYKGEAVGIIGHNGAGKSTLLKLLSRVTAPTEGEIGINGRIASMLEVGTGFNPQMTGRENIYMNGAILGMTKAEIDAKMEQIIEFSEVREFIDTPVKRYSSGMYVKLAFSVAAHLDSEIMIMDEVLAVGDMAFQKKCLEKMREAATSDGRTVLYVSHNMNTIRQLCDRCIVLGQGKVIFEGDVEEAIEVYMGTKNDRQSYINLTEVKRGDWLTKKEKCFMTSCEILNKDNVVSNDILTFRLNWNCENDIDDISLRMELRYSGQAIATSFLDTPLSCTKGDNEKVFSVNIKNLVTAEYETLFVFYHRNLDGSSFDIDAVHGFFFDKDSRNKLFENWKHRLWGNVLGEDIEIV